ncbi:hypothetical protein CKO25_17900 [Thiocapsa imhoffii]|uniref:Uncharacterized protein n=1 Tax=Thiocapsa imhoffii TaxID=382777 RepID=A0A9X0WKP3_9GAMM|nr:hypothetical protein [Thiocapsa imhoffii]MBK1646484.1 hypothetical protein [Thiocapsa imhoffii]
MQKGFGITALVIAILAIFTPFIGTWLTILVALMAVAAYGPGTSLGIASLLINIVHIMLFSPLLWATQGVAVLGAEASGTEVVFLPWLLLGVQAIALMAILLLNHYLAANSVAPALAVSSDERV